MSSLSFLLLFINFISFSQSIVPIGKLIQGTFANYDEFGAESSSLYVCKATKGRYFWSIFETTQNFSNYIVGNGMFLQSDIDFDQKLITPATAQCFSQRHGKSVEVTPCTFDASQLCDHQQITLSFTFNGETVSLDFTKISTKDELIGNEQFAPYQCGIPWDGDIPQEDEYPYSFASDAFDWSPEGWREGSVFEQRDTGCWAYVLPDDSHANANYGNFFHRQYYWDEAVVLEKWEDLSLPEDDVCHRGSEITIRVDQDVMLVGWQCKNGEYGDGYLIYKNNAWNTCPIPRG